MVTSFSPSVNIIRDRGKRFYYLPTSNSRSIYEQIASGFRTGTHSFNIIGSYGTGKSAFLLAFSKHLTGEQSIFSPVNGQFNGCKKFEFIDIVGASGSFLKAFAEQLKVKATGKDVIKALRKRNDELASDDTCLVILVDEFGKFLEYAASTNPDEELYFVQELAEFANDQERNVLFITTLHQNFDAYAIGLQEAQRKEWEKVKGRLKELTFNEPVEQLLKLAADYIGTMDFSEPPALEEAVLTSIQEARAFSLRNEIDLDFASQLYPFDILAAMAMTVALQRYGQNERSLFNFLQTEEHLGINQFQPTTEDPYYHLPQVYDYLIYNYYWTLSSKFNPDYFKWMLIRNSLERIELELGHDIEPAKKLIKTIGLIDILGSDAGKVNTKFLETYGEHFLGLDHVGKVIDQLKHLKIIRYQAFKERFKLFEGTDIDIEFLLERTRRDVDPINDRNLVAELSPYFRLDFVPAKSITYKKGTPRIFQFKLSQKPRLKFEAESPEIDGVINLLFREEDSLWAVDDQPILYGIFQNTQALIEHLAEIKTIERALKEIGDDKVARQELLELKGNQVQQLNQLINQRLFGEEGNVRWIYKGKEVEISNHRRFNQQLSTIAEEIYPGTPDFRNELMNKTRVSGSIHHAKKLYTQALIEHWARPDLGLSGKKMPAERTIYITLLKETGIHRNVTKFTADFHAPEEESSFWPLWNESLRFIESSRSGKRSLQEFVNILAEKPFKLKEGFLEFWLITFLFIHRENFALFKDGRYIPRINPDVAELFMREAAKYEIKAFNIEGVKLDLFNKYRLLTQQDSEEKITSSGFQATARPFLVFYNQLKGYAQKTQSLSHDALAFRETIKKARELEKTFFEDLPTCFGKSMKQLAESEEELNEFVDRLQGSIAELRSAYDNLVDRVEAHLLSVFGWKAMPFEDYKTKIQKRYKGIREHLLFPRQKVLFSRVQSTLDDRQSWINSIVQAVLNKQLPEISDQEEKLLLDRLTTSFRELDNLLELSKLPFDETTEEALKIEISGFANQPLKRNVILSKQQQKEVQQVKTQLQEVLKKVGDDQISRAALIKLLKEQLDHDQG